MHNLFSVFDPCVESGLPLNWIASALVLVATPAYFWVAANQVSQLWTAVLSGVYQEFQSILGHRRAPSLTFLSIGTFAIVWINNLLGLAPYVFTSTSHLTLSLTLALPIWAGPVAYAWLKTPHNSFAHLVPRGSPAALSPFIVLIELTRLLIRPLTLSVRLRANIVAGHLLMTLLRSPATSKYYPLTIAVLSALVLLAVLETAVRTIQAYVFRILTVLYVNDTNSPSLSLRS